MCKVAHSAPPSQCSHSRTLSWGSANPVLTSRLFDAKFDQTSVAYMLSVCVKNVCARASLHTLSALALPAGRAGGGNSPAPRGALGGKPPRKTEATS